MWVKYYYTVSSSLQYQKSTNTPITHSSCYETTDVSKVSHKIRLVFISDLKIMKTEKSDPVDGEKNAFTVNFLPRDYFFFITPIGLKQSKFLLVLKVIRLSTKALAVKRSYFHCGDGPAEPGIWILPLTDALQYDRCFAFKSQFNSTLRSRG